MATLDGIVGNDPVFGGASSNNEDRQFVIDDNEGTGDEAPTLEGEFGAEPFNWQDAVISGLQRDLRAAAKNLGYNQDLMDGLLNQHALGLLDFVEGILFTGQPHPSGGGMEPTEPMNAQQYQSALRLGMTYFGNQTGLGKFLTMDFSKGGGGGGGGAGSRGLTPDEIRANFDLDQLTAAVTERYRGTLLDEPKDPRAIARAYVESIVQNPNQKLDFDTFVDSRIKAQPRHKLLYGNKPRGLSEAQFMQPYLQNAMQRLRPGNVADKARAGAQLGSSPDAFRANLDRSRESQVSAPFINNMEQRMTQLGGLFRS